MPGCIYRIKNLLNNQKYIGQTHRTLDVRFQEHCGTSTTSVSPKLKNAIRKYGKSNFTIESIWEGECTEVELDTKEMELIKSEGTLHPNGYNLTLGGSGGRHSDETKKLISEKSKKAWEENGEKWRLERAEAGRSDEARAKTSESVRKVFQERPEIRELISKTHKGKKKSAETRERMSIAMQARLQTPEWGKYVQEMAKRHNKKVYRFNSHKVLMDVYPSLTQTPNDTGISLGRIRYSIKNATMVDGFYFSYSAEPPAVPTRPATCENGGGL
jgi:group I intron endonuclease